MQRALLSLALGAALSFTVQAYATSSSDTAIENSPLFADVPFEALDIEHMDIRRIIPLPLDGMSAIDNAGQVMYASSNGRFVFIGQLYDLWKGTSLDTMEEIEQATSRIYLEGLRLHPQDLTSTSIGSGPTDITFFTDPLCEHCHALAHEAKAYGDDYTFHLVVVPALGDKSHELAQHLYCAKDPTKGAEALLNGTIDLLISRNGCDMSGYEKRLLAAEILGVDGVPFLIHADGRVNRGRPQHLETWLTGE